MCVWQSDRPPRRRRRSTRRRPGRSSSSGRRWRRRRRGRRRRRCAHPLCCSHTAVVQSSSRLRWRNAASALCAYRVMGEVVYIEPDRGHASGQSMTCVRPYSTLCAPTIRHAIYLRMHSTFSMLHTCIYTAHLACCMAVSPRSHMYTGYTYRCHSHAIQSPQP